MVYCLFGLVAAVDSHEPFAGVLVFLGPVSWVFLSLADGDIPAVGWLGSAVLAVFFALAYVTMRRPNLLGQIAICAVAVLWLSLGSISALFWLAMCEKGGGC